MLEQLHNLKEEQKVPEKIDEIIKQLNENYNSLQERASVLIKNSRDSKQSSEDDHIKPPNQRSFSEKEEEKSEEKEKQ